MDFALRGRLDRTDDLDVPGATADVAGQPRQDLFAARLRRPVDEGGGRHDEAGRAEAALCGVVLVEGGLHRREVVRRAQALDRCDRGTVDCGERKEARPSGLTVDQDRAGAAPALVAAGLWARDVELL